MLRIRFFFGYFHRIFLGTETARAWVRRRFEGTLFFDLYYPRTLDMPQPN